jgi:xanthine dehydrogenase YagR molybdenum-binding subunit
MPTGNRPANAGGIPLERVSVRLGNSDLPVGPTSAASVTITNTAPAMMMAAEHAMRAGDPLLSWTDACHTLGANAIIGRGDRARAAERFAGEGDSFGAQFVDLRVDTETGQIRIDRIVAVQECGKVVCRKTAESQVIGAVTQGVSFALYEDRVLDCNTGAMLNANLEMYKWAGAHDVPHIEPIFYTNGQTGPRSLGEPPTIPTAGAIACAVSNAIGVPVRSLPLTPDRILGALNESPS